MNEDNDEELDKDEELLFSIVDIINEMKGKSLQVSDYLEEDDRDEFKEMSSGGVAGASVPLGREADGSFTTNKKLKQKRDYFASTYGAKQVKPKKKSTAKQGKKGKKKAQNKKFIRWH